MPPLSETWLYDRLMEIGPVDYAGMDREPLRWGTIAAWQDAIGIRQPPWVSRLMRRASAAWLSESRKAEKPGAPQPYQIEETVAAERTVVDRQIAAMFGGF
jgi:hypothetical protein